jgi:8-oxo-dGTP diphosphatase
MAFPTHIVAVGGIVEDGQGHILLVKTRDGGWVFPGGQVELGEDLITALCREVKEESGMDVQVRHLVGVYSNTGSYQWHDGVTLVPPKLMLDYLCEPVGGALAVSDETTDSRWVPADDVLDLITGAAIRTRYQVYRNFAGAVTYMAYVTRPAFAVSVARTI